MGVSWLTSLVLAPTREQAEAERNALLARRGMDWNTLPEHVQENLSRALLLGDPDSVCEFLQTRVLDVGVDGLVVNLPRQRPRPGGNRVGRPDPEQAPAMTFRRLGGLLTLLTLASPALALERPNILADRGRGPESADGRLRRRACGHPQHRPPGPRGHALHACVHHGRSVRTQPGRHHPGRSPEHLGRGAHARQRRRLRGGAARRLEGLSGAAARRRLLHGQQRQDRLPDESALPERRLRRSLLDLGRSARRRLAQPRAGPAVLPSTTPCSPPTRVRSGPPGVSTPGRRS